MVEQVSDGNLFLEIGEPTQVFADIIIQVESACLSSTKME